MPRRLLFLLVAITHIYTQTLRCVPSYTSQRLLYCCLHYWMHAVNSISIGGNSLLITEESPNSCVFTKHTWQPSRFSGSLTDVSFLSCWPPIFNILYLISALLTSGVGPHEQTFSPVSPVSSRRNSRKPMISVHISGYWSEFVECTCDSGFNKSKKCRIEMSLRRRAYKLRKWTIVDGEDSAESSSSTEPSNAELAVNK